MTGRADPDTRPRLSELTMAGVGHARFVFGPGTDPVPSGEVLAAGRSMYGVGADSGAVAVLMTNDRPTVEVLLGAIEAGVRLVSLPLPAATADPVAYLAFVAEACRSHGVSELVVRDDVAPLLADTVAVRPHSSLQGRPLAAPDGDGFALVQYSSGSTSQPKAVLLDDRALGANVAAIIDAVEPRPGDHVVSWLPLSHDMGLIGMVLTSLASARPGLVGGGDVVLLDPVQFLRDPAVWLRALSERSGAVTAAPDFGFRLCVDRASPAGLDLSSIRCAIVGGETIRASTLHEFGDHFAPAGFRADAFCPAYGMAEIGLAATLSRPGRGWPELAVDTLALADGRVVPVDGSGPGPVTVLVSSGRPVAGFEVRCAGADGELGRIEVRGPSTGRSGFDGRSFADHDGWFRSGDLGAVIDGNLYVSGRADDHLVAGARNIYAPAVEDAVGAIPGIRTGRAVAVGLPSGEWILAAEAASRDAVGDADARALAGAVRRAAVSIAGVRPDAVVLLGRGRLPITPSGKLQRRETVRRYLAGEL